MMILRPLSIILGPVPLTLDTSHAPLRPLSGRTNLIIDIHCFLSGGPPVQSQGRKSEPGVETTLSRITGALMSSGAISRRQVVRPGQRGDQLIRTI